MTPDTYKNAILMAEETKRLLKAIKYDWQKQNDDLKTFKIYQEPKLQVFIDLTGRNPDIGDISELCWAIGDWNKYKKIYVFDQLFMRYLEETESCKIHTELLKRLPYESFYIDFGSAEIESNNMFNYLHSLESANGMFVRVHVEGNQIDLVLQVIGPPGGDLKKKLGTHPSVLGFSQEIHDGQTFDEAVAFTIARDGHRASLEDLDVAIESWRKYFRLAVNACHYLCAANAEIRDISVPKKDRPLVQKKDGKKKPIGIKVSNVGFRLGQQFERMYRNLEVETRRVGVKGSKKKPHVRRAHWHHYWTGPGRTVLEVRWLEPVFVMGTDAEMDTVIHEVKGEAS